MTFHSVYLNLLYKSGFIQSAIEIMELIFYLNKVIRFGLRGY